MTDVFDDLAKAFKAGYDAGRAEAADEIERLREALRDIASGKYSGVLLMGNPPQDPAVVRASAALGEAKDG